MFPSSCREVDFRNGHELSLHRRIGVFSTERCKPPAQYSTRAASLARRGNQFEGSMMCVGVNAAEHWRKIAGNVTAKGPKNVIVHFRWVRA